MVPAMNMALVHGENSLEMVGETFWKEKKLEKCVIISGTEP
jgi:hypothetical protein